MHCTRCAGLRVPEILYEGGTRVVALRCVHCGDIIDRIIVLNRQRRPYPKPHRGRTPIYGSDRWKKNRPTMALPASVPSQNRQKLKTQLYRSNEKN